ncbi:Transcriptional regulator OS=Streptomyces microflavus OX=1919 GN=Smic_42980 PE=4 SV=1 [Streptomyces microflavus]
MPPRKAPTARQCRVGMRQNAGLALAEAAALLGTDRTTISNTESGRFGVSGDRVRTWAAGYACADEAYVEALVAMAEERGRGWWEDYRNELTSGPLDLAELEHHAAGIRAVQLMHMPGLIQSEDYARAVFAEAVPELPFGPQAPTALPPAEAPGRPGPGDPAHLHVPHP